VEVGTVKVMVVFLIMGSEVIMVAVVGVLVTYSQIQKSQENLSWISTKKTTFRHFIVKLLKTKDKERVLKADKK